MTLTSRIFTVGSSYRFGFNGKDYDVAFKQQDYGMRIYRFNLGRFLSVDPLTKKYAELTPYQFASNMPINSIDLDGLESFPSFQGSKPYPQSYKNPNDYAQGAMTLLWNGTLGAAGNMLNTVSSFTENGCKNGLGTATSTMIDNTERKITNTAIETYRYHTKTPGTTQLKDLGISFLNPQNYEILPSLFFGGGGGTSLLAKATVVENSVTRAFDRMLKMDPTVVNAGVNAANLEIMAEHFLDFSTKKNGAVFWGTPNMPIAQEWANFMGKTTLEQTKGGIFLDNLKLFDPVLNPGLKGSQAARIFDVASFRFAQGASGRSFVFLEGAQRFSIHGERTWWRIEQPTLIKNPKVSKTTPMQNNGVPIR